MYITIKHITQPNRPSKMELQFANNVTDSLILLFMSLYKDLDIFFSSVQFFSTKWNHNLRVSNICDEPQVFNQNPCKTQTYEGQERISIADMNVMMNTLGIVSQFEGSANFCEQDFVSLFEEQEPSLDEIKETFKVFDVNNDGFIDASDLHRFVCRLGLKERYELEDCKKMIKGFDDNGDGLIDFQMFVKFMEKCLC